MEEENLFLQYLDRKNLINATQNLVDFDNDIEANFVDLNKNYQPLASQPLFISSANSIDKEVISSGVVLGDPQNSINNIDFNKRLNQINTLISNNKFEEAEKEYEDLSKEYIKRNYGVDDDLAEQVLKYIKNPNTVSSPLATQIVEKIKKNKKDKFLNSQIQNYNIQNSKGSEYISYMNINPSSAIERRLSSYLGEYNVPLNEYLNNNYRKKVAEDSSYLFEMGSQIVGAITKLPGTLVEIGGGVFNDAYSFVENTMTKLKYYGVNADDKKYKEEMYNNFKYQAERQEFLNEFSENLKYWWGLTDFTAVMTSADDLSEYSTFKDYFLGAFSLASDFFAPQTSLMAIAKGVNWVSKGIKSIGAIKKLSGAGEGIAYGIGNTLDLGLGLLTGKTFSNVLGHSVYSIGSKIAPEFFSKFSDDLIKNSIFMSYLEYSSSSINNRIDMFEYLKSKGYSDEEAAYQSYISNMIGQFTYVLGTGLLNLGEAKRITNPLIGETADNIINRFTKENIQKQFKELKKEAIQSYYKEGIKEGIEEVLDPLSQAIGVIMGSDVSFTEKMSDEFNYKNFIDKYLRSFLGGFLGSVPNVAINNVLSQSEKFYDLSQKYKILGMMPVNSPYSYLREATEINKKIEEQLNMLNDFSYKAYSKNITQANKDLSEIKKNIESYNKSIQDLNTNVNANIDSNAFNEVKQTFSSIASNNFITNPLNSEIVRNIDHLIQNQNGLINNNDLINVMNMIDTIEDMKSKGLLNNSQLDTFNKMQEGFAYKFIKSLQLLHQSAVTINNIKQLVQYKNQLLDAISKDKNNNVVLSNNEKEIVNRLLTNTMIKSYINNNLHNSIDKNVLEDIMNIEFDSDLYEDFVTENNLDKMDYDSLILFTLDKIENGSHDSLKRLDDLGLLNLLQMPNNNLFNAINIYNDDKTNKTNNLEMISKKSREDNLRRILNNKGVLHIDAIIQAKEDNRKKLIDNKNKYGLDSNYNVQDLSLFKNYIKNTLRISDNDLNNLNIDLNNLNSKDVKKILEYSIKKSLNGIGTILTINDNQKEKLKEFILKSFDTPNNLLFVSEFLNYILINYNKDIDLVVGNNILGNIKIKDYFDLLKDYVSDPNLNNSPTMTEINITANKNNVSNTQIFYNNIQKEVNNINKHTVNINNNNVSIIDITSSIIRDFMKNSDTKLYLFNNNMAINYTLSIINIKSNTDKVIDKSSIIYHILNEAVALLNNQNVPSNLKSLTVNNIQLMKLLTPQDGFTLIKSIIEGKNLMETSSNLDELLMSVRDRAFTAMKYGVYKEYQKTIEELIKNIKSEYEKSLENNPNKVELMSLFDKKIDELKTSLVLMENSFIKNGQTILNMINNIKDDPSKMNQLLIDIINNMDLTDKDKKDIYISLGKIISNDGNLNNLINNLTALLVEEELKIQEAVKMKNNTDQETDFFINALMNLDTKNKSGELKLGELKNQIYMTLEITINMLSNSQNKTPQKDKLIDELKNLRQEYQSISIEIKNNNIVQGYNDLKKYVEDYKQSKITKEELIDLLNKVYEQFDTEYNRKAIDLLREYYNKISTLFNNNKEVIGDEKIFEEIRKNLDECVSLLSLASSYLRDIGIVEGVIYNDLIDKKINNLQNNYNKKIDILKEILSTKESFWKGIINSIWSKRTYISSDKYDELKAIANIDKNRRELFKNFNIQQLNVCF